MKEIDYFGPTELMEFSIDHHKRDPLFSIPEVAFLIAVVVVGSAFLAHLVGLV